MPGLVPGIHVFGSASKSWMAGTTSPAMTELLERLALQALPDCRLDDLVGVLDRLAALDLVDVLHAFDHLAPDGILLVEEAGVVEADEELAVGAVRALRTRHRQRAAHMRLGVELGRQI